MEKIFIIKVALFLLLALSLPSLAKSEDKILKYATSPANLVSQISASGPKSIINDLYKNEATWAYLMRQIKTGEKGWLEVAVTLEPGSDAGTASMLNEAVSLALLTNPENVLRFAVPTYELPMVCGGRADPLPTYKLALSELEDQIQSVKSVKDSSLSSLRDTCLDKLEASKEHLCRFFDVK